MTAQVVFVWDGTDAAGRKVSGELSAAEPRVARALLRRQGVVVSRLRRKRAAARLFGAGVKPEDIALFSRQMATMMRAGVPLVRAFDIVASGARNVALATIVQGVGGAVAAGSSLSQALAKYPKQFNGLYCNLVGVGEQSGTLDAMLARIAADQEHAEAIKRKVKKALFYPALVVVAAVVVCTILLVYVVPQFESVFASAGAALPAFTRFVIRCSELVQAWWWALLLVMVSAGVGVLAAQRRSRKFAAALDRIALKVPIVGAILKQAAVARYARTLGTAVAAGVPLVDALAAVADSTGNAVYVAAVRGTREDVATGQALHESMRASGVFPNMVVQMVAVGEESGSLDAMLDRAAEQFEAQVADAVDNLATLIEPLMMAVLGVLVGGLVIAMYLPVFQLGNVFG